MLNPPPKETSYEKRTPNDVKKTRSRSRFFFGLVLPCLPLLPVGVPVNADQMTGTPGSPSALQVSHLSIAFRLVVQQRPESIRQSPNPPSLFCQIFFFCPGAEMRRAMGVAVFSGMLGVTFFGLFLTPLFYVVVRTLVKRITCRELITVDHSRRSFPGRALVDQSPRKRWSSSGWM